MSDRIRLLPDSVANQIAAGEVVNRPASVVKEMMENAVDAGCKSVVVNFRDGGKELIQIVDDGCGMSPADARMAFDRHATSKIKAVDDIYAISTFGFRGEALASIAAVAEVELTTRQQSDQLGSKIEIGGGKFKNQSVVSAQTGSQFMVRNLFYNVPARRRFLDKSVTEARHITTEFQRVALCNPDIEFTLYNNDAPTYILPASSLRQRIIGVIGKHISNNLLDVSADTSIIKIEGFVGKPAASKQSNKDQFLFVNGRYFKSSYFHKAVIQAYEKLIPSNTQPAYFLYMTIDPQRIDVNVHPQKTEIKFEDNSAVWQIINAAVRESLGKLGVVPMMDFDMDTSVEIPVYRDRTVYREPAIHSNPEFNPFLAEQKQHTHTTQADYSDFMRDDDGFDQSLMEFIEGDDAEQTSIEIESGSLFKGTLSLGGRYCATTLNNELVIVDIKRAQQAILYDRYITMLGNSNSVSQQLLFPERITLSIDDAALVREHLDDFGAFGFEISFTDDQSIEVSGVPGDFTSVAISSLLYELIDALREQTLPVGELRKARLAAIMSQVGALKIIDNVALKDLLDSLSVCENANYTPDGNPVMTLMDESEIKKRLN